MKIYVKDIIEKCQAKLICGNPDIECVNFSKDTRTICKNDVYVGIKGETFDGNSFYEQALEKGASVCILDNLDETNFDYKKYQDKTVVLVEDSVKCLQVLASYKRSMYDIPVIAITGSVGKTSTKDMVASVLSKKYKVLKTEGNYNNHIGVPLTILKLKDHDCLVVEMGMNHLGEISLLTNIAKPNVAIITNVGTAHIGILGSRENILKAKLEILEGLCEDKVVIINNDNDMLHSAKSKLDSVYKLITIGMDTDSDYKASNVEINENDTIFNIDNAKIRLNISSTPFIYNSLVAFAVGKYYQIEEEKIIEAISNFELSKNRLSKLVSKNKVTIIDDTYNASYDSMKASIELLSRTSGNKKVALLGDMLELGSFSEEIHRNVGKVVVDNNIDILITVGTYSKYIDEEAIKLGFNKDNIYHFKKESDTYKLLDEILNENDVILLKASHGIGLTNVVNYLMK